LTNTAHTVFGSAFDRAQQLHDLLATEATRRGLIGPREVDRLWDRHLLNCAVITELLPDGARVVDVGSGAGLPGLPIAIRRPDLHVDLVESLQRRTEFLTEAVAGLGLAERVRVLRGRVEDAAIVTTAGSAEWVTARAVAPLDRLVRWCLPLLRPGGQLLAVKGATAATEVAEHERSMRRHGAGSIAVVQCGVDVLVEPTTVVAVQRAE
jgi:16S rRNA (guanine527-N7)-methyltransferase